VLNKLIRIDVELNEQVSSWQTYAPPPVALPLSYQNKRKWNIFRTKLITIVLGGAILMENTRWLSQDQTNMEQVEDLGQFEGGSVRGFRAGVGGTFIFLLLGQEHSKEVLSRATWMSLFYMTTR
jgi:hypothetical protein